MSGCAYPSKLSVIVISASLLSLTVLCGPARVGQATVDAARVRPHDVTPALIAARSNPNRPVLAFYYMGRQRRHHRLHRVVVGTREPDGPQL